VFGNNPCPAEAGVNYRLSWREKVSQRSYGEGIAQRRVRASSVPAIRLDFAE
jgi:hypothetical protein